MMEPRTLGPHHPGWLVVQWVALQPHLSRLLFEPELGQISGVYMFLQFPQGCLGCFQFTKTCQVGGLMDQSYIHQSIRVVSHPGWFPTSCPVFQGQTSGPPWNMVIQWLLKLDESHSQSTPLELDAGLRSSWSPKSSYKWGNYIWAWKMLVINIRALSNMANRFKDLKMTWNTY